MEKENRNTPDEPEKEAKKESYHFMNQVIKKKPFNWKKLICRILWIIGAGCGIGVLAAFVCAGTLPKAKALLGTEDGDGRISIPSDAEPTPEASASADSRETSSLIADSSSQTSMQTSSLSAESSGAGTAGSSGDSETVSGGEENGQTEGSGRTDAGTAAAGADGSAAEAGITLEQYKKLYQDMLEMTETPARAVVQVAGITNQMDYFNQNYINQQEVSGVAVAQNANTLFVLTESRVLDGAQSIQTTFFDGTVADATLVREDPNTGLAVVSVPLDSLLAFTRQNLVMAPLGNSYELKKGEPVLALGSPMGYSDSVAFGVVTSVTNQVSVLDNDYRILTTDIDGSKTGSGILVNLDGKIVGVIRQSFGAEDSNTITGLAISQIKELIESLSNNTPVPYLGIAGQTVTADISKRTGIPEGVLVTQVAADSPAMLAGIKEYDVIRDISGTSITSMRSCHTFLQSLKAGDVVTVTAMRQGAQGYEEVRFSVSVSER